MTKSSRNSARSTEPTCSCGLSACEKHPGQLDLSAFFACGEYGETTHRPHYHAILYGLSERDAQLVEDTWGKGITKTVEVTPAAIAYVAGYTSKKIGWKLQRRRITDPETGELLYEWEPPIHPNEPPPGSGRQCADTYPLMEKLCRVQWEKDSGTEVPAPSMGGQRITSRHGGTRERENREKSTKRYQ